jgi:hypothetical protein
MPKTPLETVVENWGRRIGQAQTAGIPVSAYRELGKRDIENVMKGGTPLPELQANLGIASAAMGRPIIPTPKERSGPGQILGNVAGDIGGIVRGFIPGLVRYVHHLPSEATTSIQALIGNEAARQKIGWEQHGPSAFGPAARNVARLPLFQVLPVVHTLGGLTSSEGRKELERHPVGTLLDVLPAASEISKVATLGRGQRLRRSKRAMLSAGH